MKTTSRRHHFLIGTACLVLLASPLHADFIQVFSASGINGNDSILWSQLGGDLTPLSPPVNSTTQAGQPYTVKGPSALTIFDGSTYNADFLSGDTVISAFDLNSFAALTTGIEIDLPALVLALGAQVQVDANGPFSATLSAYDATSALLGSVTVNSTVNGSGDGSAVFLGGTTTSSPIASVVFSSPTAGIALDTVTLREGAAPVPEPTSFVLVISVLVAFVLRRCVSGRRSSYIARSQ